MSDLVERLRRSVTKGHEPTDELAIEAADEIERLKAQNEHLRDALVYYAQVEGTADCVAGRALLEDK